MAWTDQDGNAMPPLQVAVTAAVSADGISELQNTRPDYCPFCEIEGRCLVEGDVLTYPFADARAPRDHARMDDQAWNVYEKVMSGQMRPLTHAHVTGVLGRSCVSRLPRFDLVHSFSPDFGRLLLRVGTVLLLIPGTNGRRLSNITPGQQMTLDAELAAALLPPFARAPSFQEGVTSWSSGQMLDWILQFSLPCLVDKWPLCRLQHWACLVKAVHLLSLQMVTEDDLEVAQSCIDSFMAGMATYFPRQTETLPVHLLTHLVEATRFLGPLWKTSSNRFHVTHQIIQVSV